MNEEKKIRVISFTKQGSRLNREIGKKLTEIGYRCSCYTVERFADKNEGELCLAPLPEKEKRSAWIGQYWGKEAFLFIGASGIAVRLIASWVKDKFTDSPVLVMDERAEYVIPLLSGHVGGAVEIAREIAGSVGAKPVITTATDVEQVLREQIRIRSICKAARFWDLGQREKRSLPCRDLAVDPAESCGGDRMQTGNGGSGDRKRTAGDPGGAWMPDGAGRCDRQYPFKAGRAGTDRAGGKAACPVSLLFCGGTDEDRGGGRILGICTVGDRGGQRLRAGGESLRAGWKAGVWKESPERHDGGGGGKRKSVEIQIGENMEQILVFSGTTEGNALVRALRAYPVHVYCLLYTSDAADE